MEHQGEMIPREVHAITQCALKRALRRNQTGDLVDRELIQTDWTPARGSRTPTWNANWTIVLGRTPSDEQLKGERRGGR